MSIIIRNKYECPYCGTELEAEICDSINADTDPVLKQRVMEGSINCAVCPGCGERVFIQQHPFLYNDRTKKLLIQYIPEDKSPDEVITPAQLAADFEGYTLRYVTKLPDLMEKVFVFEDGLNDIVVEQLKNDIWFEMQARPDPPLFIFYEKTNRGVPGGDGPTVHFLFAYADGEEHSEGFSYQSYMLSYERCKELKILNPDLNSCILIDSKYVISRMSN